MGKKTVLRRVDILDPSPDIIQEAAKIVQARGLVAFPTETVYGLGANALDETAVAAIFKAKQRPAADPIIAHIAEVESLSLVTPVPAETIEALTSAFWPGPLTLVLPRLVNVPANLSAGLDTVAVRMPAHPVAQALIRAAGVPIAAPSANLFSRPSATTADHVLADLDGRIDMILDAGPTAIGIESTVLDLITDIPTILRPGGTSLEALRQILPAIQVKQTWHKETEVGQSPGMMLKHYSPNAQVLVFSGDQEQVHTKIRQAIQTKTSNERLGLLLPEAELESLYSNHIEVVSLGSTAEDAATRLFAGLRQLDALDVDVILTRLPAYDSPLTPALQDRILRAAEGKIVSD